ncbi:MAG: Asp-tRNA(Asn)/Glu-tRNA(Gln) amidotransferase subunit GatA [Firmicutes bacterium]|nr:Asp-tRNA(Asn)/Glu-tRNA(Gln) amidotransferase subunit GatA [Bacillota bacterium]
MEILKLTALELGEKIKSKEISCRQAVEEYLKAIDENDSVINAYITVLRDEALARADEVQAMIDRGELADSPLAGVPVAIKDNMCTKGVLTSAASNILNNFKPPYDATVVEKVKAAGGIIIGKVNMDEFAMGGSTETSHYGVTANPWDTKRVPGGSSGGSAAAVASGMAPYSLGSDTGGSIRQPAAFTGLTGIKPTYGSVSRYGLLAYASSLDQIGPVAHDIKDAAAALSMISGTDKRDSTSVIGYSADKSAAIKPGKNNAFDFTDCFADEADPCAKIRGMKIGIPANYYGDGLDPEIKEAIFKAIDMLKAGGAVIEEFDMPIIDYAVPAYYIIACAEASSNLSRYDGIKYGRRTKEANDLIETYYKSRSEGFGAEVKRRIMLGSFVLSSGYFDAYYKKALQVRGLIKKAFDEAYEKYDAILSPVSPTVAYEIGGQIADPIAMYMADIYTVSVNLAGLPAVSVPCGFSKSGMPVGMQFIGDSFQEEKIIKMASAYQAMTDYHTKRPGIFGNAEKGGDN